MDILSKLIATGRVEQVDGIPINQFLKKNIGPTGRSASVALAASKPRTAKQAREQGQTNLIHPELDRVRRKAQAILVIPGKAVRSTNALKWRHWAHHLRERNEAARLLEQAHWEVSFGGAIPTGHGNRKQALALIWYGKRLMDRTNFAEGCKGLLDELVARGLLVDDNPHWLKDQYYPELSDNQRLEIVFLGPCS